jgi:ADP-ribose pyrophosphatase
MPKKVKAVKPAASKKTKTATVKKAKNAKPKAKKALKAKKTAKAAVVVEEKAQVLSSEVAFEGPLFRVEHDQIIEPGGKQCLRDIIRHNGSVVILALDNSKNKKNPWIVMERQYRYAAGQFMWEIPAGKVETGEDILSAAKRELEEETGYRAKKWKPLVEYFPSPGFLGETMKIFVAEGLMPGNTNPDDDELIELRLIKLSDVLKMIGKGAIIDGKTLTSVLLYARKLAAKRTR